MPLFDRPLQRDVLLQLYVAAVSLVAFVSGCDNIDPGSSYNSARAGRLISTITVAAFLAFLVIALIPAVIRRELRQSRPASPPNQFIGDGYAFQAPLRPRQGHGPTGPRARGWTSAAPRRMDVGIPSSSDEAKPLRAPTVSVSLESQATIPDVPVRLTWDAPGADRVFISELPGAHPASGSADLYLASSRDVTVTAVNDAGSTVKRSHLIRVLPTPVIEVVRLPAPPSITLRAEVDVSLDWRPGTVLSRLDAILDEQEQRRISRSAVLPEKLSLQEMMKGIRETAGALAAWRPRCFPATPQTPTAAPWWGRLTSRSSAFQVRRLTGSSTPILRIHAATSESQVEPSHVSVLTQAGRSDAPGASSAAQKPIGDVRLDSDLNTDRSVL